MLTMRIGLSIAGAMLFLAATALGLYLLVWESKLSGAEFVAFVVAFAVVGLVLAFASEVQEFSLAGNIVKLKDIKRDVEKSVSELKTARTETFRFLLLLAKRHPGGYEDANSPVDGRVNDFLVLHEQIVAFECQNELASTIYDVVRVLIPDQFGKIASFSDSLAPYQGLSNLPDPKKLTIDALAEDSVQKAANRIFGGDVVEVKSALLDGIEAYRQLYRLHHDLQRQLAE